MKVYLPDSAVKEFDGTVTGHDIAGSIGKRLANNAVAIDVNGVLQDLSDEVGDEAQVSIVTLDSEQGLEIMRHTIAAQVFGRAVKTIYPNAELAIGPTVKDGFYYDVDFKEKITAEDLAKIEEEMRKVVSEGRSIVKMKYSREAALELFAKRREGYKKQIIDESTEGDFFNIYQQEGTDFIDLCRGPHLPSLKQVGAFKLTQVAGAYWRGNNNNPMLTRIYGTAWKNEKQLNAHLEQQAEIERRDHRKLNQKMDLFHFSNESPGQVFWHEKGWTAYKELEGFVREKLKKNDYKEVNTPRMVSKSMYMRSGHWEKFGTNNMFVAEAYGDLFALKPMNCPSHVELFNNSPKSYKDLPLRIAEFGNCYRQELSGALHGLMRVTSMTQDDAHIFCTLDQIKDEIVNLNAMIDETYTDLGFTNYYVRFSDRPEKRIGSDAVWDKAESSLKEACDAAGVNWIINPGEGAFYGPKLEYVLTDAIGRDWQCGTIQLDFNLPERLDASYTNNEGKKERPVMIHRAILGTLERFMGIYLEHHAGNLPLWISPSQIVFSGITDNNKNHVQALTDRFKAEGIRATHDNRNEKINYKIREHMNAKTAIVGIVGDKEQTENAVTIRRLGSNEQVKLPADELLSIMKEEIKTRTGKHLTHRAS
jgi:threonyl-tRNA synthetase